MSNIDRIAEILEQSWRDNQISTIDQALKFAIYSKNQETLDMVKAALGNPRELLNLKIEQIKSYQVLEKEDKLSIQFELHETL